MISFLRKRGKNKENPTNDMPSKKIMNADLSCKQKHEKRKKPVGEEKVDKSNGRSNGYKQNHKEMQEARKKPEKVLKSIFPKNDRDKSESLYSSLQNVFLPEKKQASSRQHPSSPPLSQKHNSARRQNLLTLIASNKEISINEPGRQTLRGKSIDKKRGISCSRKSKPNTATVENSQAVKVVPDFQDTANKVSSHSRENASNTTGNDSFVTATEIGLEMTDIRNVQAVIGISVSNDKANSEVTRDSSMLRLTPGQETVKLQSNLDEFKSGSVMSLKNSKNLYSEQKEVLQFNENIYKPENCALESEGNHIRLESSSSRSIENECSHKNALFQFDRNECNDTLLEQQTKKNEPQLDKYKSQYRQDDWYQDHSASNFNKSKCETENVEQQSDQNKSKIGKSNAHRNQNEFHREKVKSQFDQIVQLEESADQRQIGNKEDQFSDSCTTKFSKSYHKKPIAWSVNPKFDVDLGKNKQQESALSKILITQSKHLLDFLKGNNLPSDLEARKRWMTDTIERIASADPPCGKCRSTRFDITSHQCLCLCRSHAIHKPPRNQGFQNLGDSKVQEMPEEASSTMQTIKTEEKRLAETPSFKNIESDATKIDQNFEVKNNQNPKCVNERKKTDFGKEICRTIETVEILKPGIEKVRAETKSSPNSTSIINSEFLDLPNKPIESHCADDNSTVKYVTPGLLAALAPDNFLEHPVEKIDHLKDNCTSRTIHSESLETRGRSPLETTSSDGPTVQFPTATKVCESLISSGVTSRCSNSPSVAEDASVLIRTKNSSAACTPVLTNTATETKCTSKSSINLVHNFSDLPNVVQPTLDDSITSTYDGSEKTSSYIVVYTDKNTTHNPRSLVEKALKIKSGRLAKELDLDSQDTLLEEIKELCEEILEFKMQSFNKSGSYDVSTLTNSSEKYSCNSSGTDTNESQKSKATNRSAESEEVYCSNYSQSSQDYKKSKDNDSCQKASADQTQPASEITQRSENSASTVCSETTSNSEISGSINRKKTVNFKRIDCAEPILESSVEKYLMSEVKTGKGEEQTDKNKFSYTNYESQKEEKPVSISEVKTKKEKEKENQTEQTDKSMFPDENRELKNEEKAVSMREDTTGKEEKQKNKNMFPNANCVIKSEDKAVSLPANDENTSVGNQYVPFLDGDEEFQSEAGVKGNGTQGKTFFDQSRETPNYQTKELKQILSYDHWVTTRKGQSFRDNSLNERFSGTKTEDKDKLQPETELECSIFQHEDELEGIEKTPPYQLNELKKNVSFDHWVTVRKDKKKEDTFLNERQCPCTFEDSGGPETARTTCDCDGKMFDSLETQISDFSPKPTRIRDCKLTENYPPEQAVLNVEPKESKREETPDRIIRDVTNESKIVHLILKDDIKTMTSNCEYANESEIKSTVCEKQDCFKNGQNHFAYGNETRDLERSRSLTNSLSISVEQSLLCASDKMNVGSDGNERFTKNGSFDETGSTKEEKTSHFRTYSGFGDKHQVCIGNMSQLDKRSKFNAEPNATFPGAQMLYQRDSKQSILSTTEGVLKIPALDNHKQNVTVLFEEVLPLQNYKNFWGKNIQIPIATENGIQHLPNTYRAKATSPMLLDDAQSGRKLQISLPATKRQHFKQSPRSLPAFSNHSDTKQESLKIISPKYCLPKSIEEERLPNKQSHEHSSQFSRSLKPSVNEPHVLQTCINKPRLPQNKTTCVAKTSEIGLHHSFLDEYEALNDTKSAGLNLPISYEESVFMRKGQRRGNISQKIPTQILENVLIPSYNVIERTPKLHNELVPYVSLPFDYNKHKRFAGSNNSSHCESYQGTVNDSPDDSTFNSKDSDLIRFCETLNLKTIESEINCELCTADSSNLMIQKINDNQFQIPSSINVFTQKSEDTCVACEVAKLKEGRETEAPIGICNTSEKKRKKRQDSKHSVHFEPKIIVNQNERFSVNPVQSCSSFIYSQTRHKDLPKRFPKNVRSEPSTFITEANEVSKTGGYNEKYLDKTNEKGYQFQHEGRRQPAFTTRHSFTCCPSLDKANEPIHEDIIFEGSKEKDEDISKNLIVLPLTGCHANVFIDEPGVYQLHLMLPETEMNPIKKKDSSLKTSIQLN